MSHIYARHVDGKATALCGHVLTEGDRTLPRSGATLWDWDDNGQPLQVRAFPDCKSCCEIAKVKGTKMDNEKTAKKRGWPESGEAWTTEHDLLWFARMQRMLAKVPKEARNRVKAYTLLMVQEWEP